MLTPPILASALALTVATGGIGIDPPVQPIQLISHAYGQPSTPVWDAFNAQISADGGYIAFTSAANDLTEAPDTNAKRDIFLYDTGCDRMQRISDAVGGAESNGDSHDGSVSRGGRYVAFSSYASNLVPGDSNGVIDVFLLDRADGSLRRISAAPPGSPRPNKEGSWSPRISADGRFVVFTSETDNFLRGDNNHDNDVFLYEIASGRIELISRAANGGFGDRGSGSAEISADGQRIVFLSQANNLLGTTVERGHLYLRDRTTGITELVDRAVDGTPADYNSVEMFALSGDGRYVAFNTTSARLWPGTWSGRVMFLRDTQLNTLRPITTAPGDAMNGWYSSTPALNHNGQWLAYMSGTSSLDPVVRQRSMYLRKVVGDSFALTPTDADTSEGTSWFPSVSAEGTRVVFGSNTRDLIPGARGRQIYMVDYGGASPGCSSSSGK